jgi:hypothetical protein
MTHYEPFIRAAALTPFCTLLFFVPLWGPPLVFLGLGKKRLVDDPLPPFATMDLFVLFGGLAVANGLASSFFRDQVTTGALAAIVLMASFFVVAVWLVAQRDLRAYHIARMRSRFLFQIVILPLAILGPSAIPATVLQFLLREERSTVNHLELTAAVVTLLFAFFTCSLARLLFRRILP